MSDELCTECGEPEYVNSSKGKKKYKPKAGSTFQCSKCTMIPLLKPIVTNEGLRRS